VPEDSRLKSIAKDHQNAINGGMFFSMPDGFDVIIKRIREVQDQINVHRKNKL
jgi:hypothetical protein